MDEFQSDEDCVRYIHAIVSQLTMTSLVQSRDEKESWRPIFTTLVRALDKGDLRSKLIKQLDHYFELLYTLLLDYPRSSEEEVVASEVIANPFTKDKQLLMCQPHNIYRLLCYSSSVSLSQMSSLVLRTETFCDPSQLMNLLLNHIPLYSCSDKPKLDSIIKLYSFKLARSFNWRTQYPYSIGALIGLQLCLQTSGKSTPLINFFSSNTSPIPHATILAFLFIWKSKLSELMKEDEANLIAIVESLMKRIARFNSTPTLEKDCLGFIQLLMSYDSLLKLKCAPKDMLSTFLDVLFAYWRSMSSRFTTPIVLDHLHSLNVALGSPEPPSTETPSDFSSWIKTMQFDYIAIKNAIISSLLDEATTDLLDSQAMGNDAESQEEVDIHPAVTYQIDVLKEREALRESDGAAAEENGEAVVVVVDEEAETRIDENDDEESDDTRTAIAPTRVGRGSKRVKAPKEKATRKSIRNK